MFGVGGTSAWYVWLRCMDLPGILLRCYCGMYGVYGVLRSPYSNTFCSVSSIDPSHGLSPGPQIQSLLLPRSLAGTHLRGFKGGV